MTKLIVFFGFVLAFAAGLLTASRFMPPPRDEAFEAAAPGTQPWQGGATTRPGPPMMHRGFLPRELNLSGEQQAKIQEIWSNVGVRGPREMDEKRRELSQARDAEVVKLIPSDNQPAYEKLQGEFISKMQAVDAEFREAFDNAVKQTEALLTDEQRQKYQEIRGRMQPPHDGFGHGPDNDGPNGHGHDGHGHHDHGGPMGLPGGFDGGPGGPPPGPRDGGF